MTGNKAFRAWLAGGVVGGLIIAILAWFFAINPQLSDASSLRDQTDQAKTQNALLSAKVDQLRALDANREGLLKDLKAATSALPSSSGLDAFTVEVNQLATANLLDLQSITASTPAAVGGPGAATAGAGTQSTSTGETTSTPATSAAQAATYSIKVAINVIGQEARINRFVEQLQQGPRKALVTNLQIAAAGNAAAGNTLSAAQATITANVFVQPLSPEQQQVFDKMLGAGTSK